MSRRRSRAGATLALAALLAAMPACIGPNHASGHLAKWNMDFEHKWAREGIFILVFPAYLITGLGDILIFNPIQWWSGENPISRPGQEPGPLI